ncbi:MAG: polysaccharide deacetylase family protein [candidate division NC10 bacterium]|nr:polysaccharide deacetylase family protein [candidate division NC10 bacterium]
MKAWIQEYLRGLRKSCPMRKQRVVLVGLSPLLFWGPLPVQVALHAVIFTHLSAWLYGVLAPNSRLFGPVFSRGSSQKRWVALTFDDGPSEPYSSLVLDTLRRHQVKASFFIVGARVKAHADLVRRIWEEGHLIGNHTWSHPSHLALAVVFRRRQVREEMDKAEAAIEALTGERPRVFRPPQGFKNLFIAEACQEKGLTLVGYTVRPPYHANGHSSLALASRILRRVRPGAIINFHDGWRTGHEWDHQEMMRVLSQVIEGLKGQGYEFVTLREMIQEGGGVP